MKNNYFNNNKYYIVVFKSKNYAIKTYYYLEKKGYKKFQLISTPCQIKAGCSYSIKFNNLDDFQMIRDLKENIDNYMSSIYLIERNKGRKYVSSVAETI